VNKSFKITVLLIILVAAGTAEAASQWRVSLPDTVFLTSGIARLRDVSSLPVPAGAADLVLQAGMRPNTAVRVSRQKILRVLGIEGLGGGVSFVGAESCYLVFGGARLSGRQLERKTRHAVQKLVPPTESGAPGSWFDLVLPSVQVATTGDWTVDVDRQDMLAPGRNLVQVRITDAQHREAFSASVILHSYGETARAVTGVERGEALQPGQFRWQWQDRALLDGGVVANRVVLNGASASRSIPAGGLLRAADLKKTPVILAGDAVELRVVRGRVAVTVRAFARQDGAVGQTIPVRNELTGRLVNARIAGPGLVEWRN